VSVEKAFEVPSIVINDLGGILSGTADPNVPGLNAPIGSIYLRDNAGAGEHWKKVGALDTDWNLEQTSGAGGEEDAQIAEATSITSTTSSTPIDLNSMTLTTSNTASKKYEVHFGCVFEEDDFQPAVFDIVVDGVLQHRRRTAPPEDDVPGNFQTSYLTAALATGLIIKVQFFRENSGTVEVTDRTLIINGRS